MASEAVMIDTTDVTQAPVVLDEVVEQETYGQFTGSTKWFNDKLGYGFITICDGEEKGKDIFVHHSGIKPLNSNYKTLRKGEYIQFNIINGLNGLQAVDVTGIKGGPLMCDYVTSKRVGSSSEYPVRSNEQAEVSEWQTVPVRRARAPTQSTAMPQMPHRGKKSVHQHKNVAKYNKATRKQLNASSA